MLVSFRRLPPKSDQTKAKPDRIDAKGIMGKQSANQVRLIATLFSLTLMNGSGGNCFGILAQRMTGRSPSQRYRKYYSQICPSPSHLEQWLHRSAYSFGGMLQYDFQSPQNIVSPLFRVQVRKKNNNDFVSKIFGTYEANSDMTRYVYLSIKSCVTL